jgi:hypothetical protein
MSNEHIDLGNLGDLDTEERRWADRAGKALRESEAQLDAVTVARLRAARARAMERAAAPAAWTLPGLLPAGGIGAAALAVAVLAWTLLPRGGSVPEVDPVNLAGVDALELLTDEQGPEFYQNLDLYLWLEEPGEVRSSGA